MIIIIWAGRALAAMAMAGGGDWDKGPRGACLFFTTGAGDGPPRGDVRGGRRIEKRTKAEGNI